MLNFLFYDQYSHRFARYFLGVFWCSGVALGITCVAKKGINFLYFAPNFEVTPLSIFYILIPICSAFIITVLALVLSSPSLFYVAALTRGFIFGFILNLMTATSQHDIILFSCIDASLRNSVLLWFWNRHITGYKTTLIRDLMLCVLIHLICFFAFTHLHYY